MKTDPYQKVTVTDIEQIKSLLQDVSSQLQVIELESKEFWTMRDLALYLKKSPRQAHRIAESSNLKTSTIPGSTTKIVRRVDVLRALSHLFN